jgi:signal transduction histidine kinase/CheY-like chemotaxis protein
MLGPATGGCRSRCPGMGAGTWESKQGSKPGVWGRYRNMRLATRLLLIILTCLVPIIALAGWVEYSHWLERRTQLGDLALQQAELLNGDIASIADGARILLSTAAEFPEVRNLAPACGERLASVGRDLPMFAFVALVDQAGMVVCASRPGLHEAGDGTPGWVRDAMAATEFSAGRYAAASGLGIGFLPFALPMTAADPAQRRILVTGLDLGWLSQHLQEIRQSGSRFLAGSVLSVADRDGYILARSPQHVAFVGKRFPAAALPLVSAARSGVARLKSVDGTERVIGYIPASQSRYGLLVSIGFYEPDLMTDISRASLRGGLLLACVAIGAFLLTLFVARRFIGRPTRELLDAVRRWRAGDLAATAPCRDQRSEFGQIAMAYNDLVRTLASQEEKLRQHAEAMEARVAERTHDLLVSNNRLQVEIAERQNTEAALVQSQKLQAVGQLAGGIAHDFNNLLATIQGSLDLLSRCVPPSQQDQHGWIERASGAVHRGSQLTGRLLAFSRRQRPAVEASDVNRLVTDLVPVLRTGTHGERIRIDTDLGADLWPAVVDASQVEAAILNLALNARDAMPDGGVLTIATANHVVRRNGKDGVEAGDYVLVTVTDTGVGMTDEVAQHALEPFFTTKGPSGSGLGLSQVQAMVSEAGGGVRIASAPGRGTSVTLLLPRAAELSPSEEADASEQKPQAKLRVLVADDDPDVLQVTADMLRQLGHCVVTAESGPRALALLEERPTTVMLDYAMPSMTGLEVAAAMRTRGFAGPIILATGYAELSEAEHAERATLQGMLNKPYTIRDLETLLARVGAEVPPSEALPSSGRASLQIAK